VLVALAFLWFALSQRGLEVTTPLSMAHHEIARKAYALAAFTVFGFLFDRSRIVTSPNPYVVAFAGTLFSTAIEILQVELDHTPETLIQHGFDIVSGFAGGGLGAALSQGVLDGRRIPRSFVQVILLTFILLIAAYRWIYGRYSGWM
jgi:hypothetical protein